MGFMSLFEVASMPILQVIIVSSLGAFMATNYLNLLPGDTRKSLNKIVFVVFTPSLMFASLIKTVTFQDIVTWWFMPINVGITFLCGGILGWIAVKILKPQPHLEGLIIAVSSSANLGNLLLIIVPAICSEGGSPFGSHSVCSSNGLSYASFSMALGGLYIWTYTYHLIRSSALKFKAMRVAEEDLKQPNKDLNVNEKTHLLSGEAQEHVAIVVSSTKSDDEDPENQHIVHQGLASKEEKEKSSFLIKVAELLHMIVEEVLAPPTLGAIAGFFFGAIPLLKNLLIGDDAPLRVIYDSVKLLGDGTIPCITLILGGNLTQGLRKASLTPLTIIVVICVRYIILPVIGIGVVKTANNLGILPSDPLFQFVLMLQFTLPPAMNIGTMTQLLEVGQEECSVLLMWTYLAATIALTSWSTVFMWILT